MGVRAKTTVLMTLEKHFLDFELPLDIDQKSYMNIVGKNAVSAVAIKRSFKAWKYAMVALRNRMRVVNKEIKPAPKPTLLDIRNRWRNSTADPSSDPYAGVNVATIVNKHGEELASGTDLERQYLRGALIEIWRSNAANGMDYANQSPDAESRWVKFNLGPLTESDKEHMSKKEEKKPSLGGLKSEKKLSGLEALRANLEVKDE